MKRIPYNTSDSDIFPRIAKVAKNGTFDGMEMTDYFENRRLLWCEAPYSEQGKRNEVYHYRLFCDKNWQPIMPRGEVYSKQFTELGWKSFSELHNR